MGTVGTPVEGVTIELDAETGRLRVSSAAVAEGYLPQPAPELAGGSFLTGDLAAWDEGRRGRAPSARPGRRSGHRQGQNVQPREVENLLRDLPGVDDVCVLGVDGPEGPRTVLRAVFGAATAAVTFESVVEHCRGKLAEHKIPRSIVVLPELPRDGRGKLDRRQLADPALPSSAAFAGDGTSVTGGVGR